MKKMFDFSSDVQAKDLNLHYGGFHALKGITARVPSSEVTAIIGPSGCGKSTLLRCFNRMNDFAENIKITGDIFVSGSNIMDKDNDLVELRRKVGMVFQRPNVFPLSIHENLAFGLKIHRAAGSKKEIDNLIEKSLKDVGLWDVLKDKLRHNAGALTLEQQQRLCIARVLILKPQVVLLDEPCSALDPLATAKIEELLLELKKDYSIIIVTHNMQQAARISAFCGFMFLGELVEFDKTSTIFTSPAEERTENYITGKFG